MRTGRPPRDPRERLLERVVIDEASGCWLWTGAISITGYGQIAMPQGGGKRAMTRAAHRVAYELFVGPIPDGLTIDHVLARGCRSRHCVNPAHLEAVTMAENARRRPYYLKEHCPQGHHKGERDSRGFRICRECARIRTRAWRQKNKEHRAAYAREYRRRLKEQST